MEPKQVSASDLSKHQQNSTDTTYPVLSFDDVGWLTETQMIEVDRVMIEDLRIELIQMMENAGRNLARLVIDRFSPATVTVLAGSGGNGGGGLVAARHLANHGVDVSVTLAQPVESWSPVTAHQYDILERMGLAAATDPRQSDVFIDALIGYSLKGPPRGRIGQLIEILGENTDPTVALDTPSGLNVTDGSIPGDVVAAEVTMTLAFPKIGLRNAEEVGDLYVADISVPPSVFDTLDVGPTPDFTRSSIVKLHNSAKSTLSS